MDFSFSPITVTRFDEACVTSLETCFFGFFFLSRWGEIHKPYILYGITIPANGTRLRASGSRWATIKFAAYIIIVGFIFSNFYERHFLNKSGLSCESSTVRLFAMHIRKTCSAAGSQIISLPCICITQLIRHDVIAAGIEKTQQQPEWPDTSAQLYVYS